MRRTEPAVVLPGDSTSSVDVTEFFDVTSRRANPEERRVVSCKRETSWHWPISSDLTASCLLVEVTSGLLVDVTALLLFIQVITKVYYYRFNGIASEIVINAVMKLTWSDSFVVLKLNYLSKFFNLEKSARLLQVLAVAEARLIIVIWYGTYRRLIWFLWFYSTETVVEFFLWCLK